MKKRNIFILILVIIVAVAAITVWWVFFRNSAGIPVEKPLDVQAEIIKCEKEKAYFKAQCFQDLAVKAKNPDLCKRVSDIKDVGYEGSNYIIHEGVCLALVSEQLNYDISLCDRVKDDKDQFELCTGYSAQLHAKAVRDPKFCEILDHKNMWYGNCLAASVVKEADISVCDKATGFYKEVCRDQAYMNLMNDNKDISYCDKVKNSSNLAVCKANYAKDVGDLNICGTLGSDKSMCICYNMYFEQINENVCNDLSDSTQNANCKKCLKMNLFK